MIDRYLTKDMKRIWSDQNKFKTWELVELTVAEIMSNKGIVPKSSLKVIKSKAQFYYRPFQIHGIISYSCGNRRPMHIYFFKIYTFF